MEQHYFPKYIHRVSVGGKKRVLQLVSLINYGQCRIKGSEKSCYKETH